MKIYFLKGVSKMIIIKKIFKTFIQKVKDEFSGKCYRVYYYIKNSDGGFRYNDVSSFLRKEDAKAHFSFSCAMYIMKDKGFFQRVIDKKEK